MFFWRQYVLIEGSDDRGFPGAADGSGHVVGDASSILVEKEKRRDSVAPSSGGWAVVETSFNGDERGVETAVGNRGEAAVEISFFLAGAVEEERERDDVVNGWRADDGGGRPGGRPGGLVPWEGYSDGNKGCEEMGL
jgi:hypothetical protein